MASRREPRAGEYYGLVGVGRGRGIINRCEERRRVVCDCFFLFSQTGKELGRSSVCKTGKMLRKTKGHPAKEVG